VQLYLVPLALHLGSIPVLALLVLAHEGVGLAVGFLFLLPLHGVLLGLVLVHLPRVDAAPPDPLLLLAQLALPAPLLGCGFGGYGTSPDPSGLWCMLLPGGLVNKGAAQQEHGGLEGSLLALLRKAKD